MTQKLTAIATVLLLTIGTPLVAENAAQPEPEMSALEWCSSIGSLAHSIMERRQEGFPMSEMMSMIDALPGEDGLADPLAISIVKQAYNQPRWPTGEFRVDAVKDFRNDIESDCFRDFH